MSVSNIRSIQSRFEKFNSDHPEVLASLERLAGQWFDAGHSQVGIGMLWERLRWETGLGSQTEQFRLSNDHRSRYVRLIIERNPEWANRFRTRELRAA